ncbi:putative damage-inducible protein DinB [Peribacillus sp. B2I2]
MKTCVAELGPHVVNHGTYHRGNITAMLRQMGYASISTDYGLYLFLKGE